jgi:glutaredoxin-related protein
MPRLILPEDKIHPSIRDVVSRYQSAIVDEVRAALAAHRVVVVGMAQNPHCRQARRALAAAGIVHEYLEYGSYLSQWRRRSALKLWTGWPTFPMVFVDGMLIGGADDLQALIASGELGLTLASSPG